MRARALTRLAAVAAALFAIAISSDSPAKHVGWYSFEQPNNIIDHGGDLTVVFSAAAGNTTVLYQQKFDSGASCTQAGWTKVDISQQLGEFFHVDTFAAITLTKSLWLGAAATVGPPLCSYATLPGYGNNWDQAWCTKTCIPITGNLDVSFDAAFDFEFQYDILRLEVTSGPGCFTAGAWDIVDQWDGGVVPATSYSASYTIAPPGNRFVRFHFQSDPSWSDEDGLYDSVGGPVVIDNLLVEGLPLEDFEGEVLGATSSNDWQSCNPVPFGQYMGLFKDQVQQGQTKDLSCVWAAIQASTDTYACGGFPIQLAVPKGNAKGLYIHNEIWSPNIPLVGTGERINLEFDVYKDNPLGNLVFYTWRIRPVTGGCPGQWRDNGYIYYGKLKGWTKRRFNVGPLLNPSATGLQVALGVVDMCWAWGGVYGTCACHSHAPMFDNVKVYRVTNSPQWTIHDVEQFQDNFATDGTVTGTVRADIARDISPINSPTILPGDSAVVTVDDPVDGLAADLINGGKKVYLYVAVWPQGQPKLGAGGSALTQNPTRWPVVGTQVIAGATWHYLRLDPVLVNGVPMEDRYCVDLNDNLFTPGDTVCFFYSAENGLGVKAYAFGTNLGVTGSDINQAAANPSEFTCLPAGGWNRGGDILYVDGMDGRGAQPLWDITFKYMGIDHQVDRYDVRGPTSAASNRLSSRVTDVTTQLVGCYRKILWDCGDLEVTIGDGSGGLYKENDYGLINQFMDNLTLPGGVYLAGDHLPSELSQMAGASSVQFRSMYVTYNLASDNHAQIYGFSPAGVGTPTGAFAGDTFTIWGGGHAGNSFDVMSPTGASKMEVSYGAPAANNGAVISKVTVNSNAVAVGALLGGFAFEYIRDDEADGVVDRMRYLHEALAFLGNIVYYPLDAGPVAKNSLMQNYPNPFNPQTTISFSLRERGKVSLRVYDVSGALVRTLADEELAAGAYTRVWDGRGESGAEVASGVYFYRIVAGDFVQSRKMVLLK